MVLCAYFAGLTLGAAAYGKWLAGRFAPLRIYAAAELGVAIWIALLGLGFEVLFSLSTPILAGAASNFALLQTARFITAACWILPPTFLMGISLPAIVDALPTIGVSADGRAVARFYSWNLAGAIIGALLAPYLLFPYLGIDRALMVCALLDAAVAWAAIKLASGGQAPTPVRTGGAPVLHTTGNRQLYFLAFLSGVIFFSLEIVWTHLIAAVIGNSVYAFATMLAVVLIGLGCGGALATVTGESITLGRIGQLLLVGAAMLVITHALWPLVPHLLATAGSNITSFGAAEALKFAAALILILPAATFFGMFFPGLFRLSEMTRTGSVVGRTVAANAIGCMTGAMLTGFVFIPRFGSERTLASIAIIAAVVGAACGLPRRAALSFAVALIAVILLIPRWDQQRLTSGEHVYFRPTDPTGSRLLFFHEDTFGGITTVVADSSGTRTLLTNGKFQGNDGGEMHAQTGFALIPMMFVERPGNALVIGLGTGRSAHVVHASGFAQVDVAEIAPGIVAAAREHFSHINGNVLRQPNVSLKLEDGRNYLLLTDRKFDLITMEVTSIWFAGATNLYSRQFYETAKKGLQPGGVLQQWVQIHHIGPEELLSAIMTVREVFPNVSFWVYGGQGLIVASHEPQVVRRIHDRSLLSARILSPEAVSRIRQSVPFVVNDDRNRYLEYFTPRYNYDRRALEQANLELLSSLRTNMIQP